MNKETLQTGLEIMDDLMSAITQTEEWERIQLEDPQIREAEAKLELELKNVSHFVPFEVFAPLEDCVRNAAYVYADAAILYGIQVADAIHAVSSKPSLLSQHILDRISAQKSR